MSSRSRTVVGRAVALDELRLEEERLGLGVGGDDLHAARLGDHALEALGEARDLGVVGDAVAERPRLADIEDVALGVGHAIDAGADREGLHDRAEGRDAGLQVRRVAAADGIGRFFLVEAVGGGDFGHEGDLGPTNAGSHPSSSRRKPGSQAATCAGVFAS